MIQFYDWIPAFAGMTISDLQIVRQWGTSLHDIRFTLHLIPASGGYTMAN